MHEEIFLRQFTKLSFMLLCGSLCFMGGCGTTIQPPKNLKTIIAPKKEKKLSQLNDFETIGKIGFSDGKKGGNATIQWEQEGENYHIRLFGPLGSGSIQIVGEPKQVYLISEDGQIVHAKNPESLVEKELGWTIPVSGLRYWLRGLPAPGTPPQQIQLDDMQRIWQIKQHDWTITYQSYQETQGVPVPHKLMLQNGPIRLKFIFRRWRLR